MDRYVFRKEKVVGLGRLESVCIRLLNRTGKKIIIGIGLNRWRI